jgi:oligopeptide/dipeptide ABC transporter ATP-binding protein
MAEPDLLICDEPVSALDVSVQAQILNLLADLKDRFGLTMVFIAHDLAVVKNVSDRVAVMYLGKLVEVAGSDELYRAAAHPYTEALLASIPEPDPDQAGNQKALTGELPSPLHPPSGCRFRTRCPYAQALCAEQEPPLRDISPGHQVACHFPLGQTNGTPGPVEDAQAAEPANPVAAVAPVGPPGPAEPPVIPAPVAAPPVAAPPVAAPPVTAPPVATPPVTTPPVPAAPGGSSATPPGAASADPPAMMTEPGQSDPPKQGKKKRRKKKSE